MKKSLIAAALALAGVAAHATTVSDLQIPFVGGLTTSLVPYKPGQTPAQWDVDLAGSGSYEISFKFEPTGATTDQLIFAMSFGGGTGLFGLGSQAIGSAFNGVVLAYNPATGAACGSGSMGTLLGTCPGTGYSGFVAPAGAVLSGRVVLAFEDDPVSGTTAKFTLEIEGLPEDSFGFTTVAYVEQGSVTGPFVLQGASIGFASVQPGGQVVLNTLAAPVPEASSVALALAGLGVVAGVSASRRRAARS